MTDEKNPLGLKKINHLIFDIPNCYLKLKNYGGKR